VSEKVQESQPRHFDPVYLLEPQPVSSLARYEEIGGKRGEVVEQLDGA
jgi:hypothetical protein